MKINLNNTQLVMTAGNPKQFPVTPIPQIALAGRSNVGKSSLVNCLLNRKSLARVSGEPGKTITINFYEVDKKLFLVDLPGYGYAKRTKADIVKWSSLTDGYFTKNPHFDLLKLVVQLIDCRTGPTDNDIEMLEFLKEYEIPHIVVATKIDKLNATQRKEFTETVNCSPLYENADAVIFFSAKSKEGKDALWNEIINHSQN